MLRKKLFSSILFILLPFTIWCSERAGRPVQLQLVNFSGVALGYHISDSIYLGYTYVSSMDLSLEPQNPRALYGQDYVEKVDVEEDQDQSIELRISPFENGLYFSLGALSTGSKYQKVTFEKRNRVLPNDTQLPSTKIFVVTEVEPWSGLGLGLGYTAIWDFGLSIGLGVIFSPDDSKISEIQLLSLLSLIGWLGCQVDSILGAVLENRGYLGKHSVNFLATFSGSLMAIIFYYQFLDK